MAARLTSIIVMVIVAATIIAGIIAGAQRDDSGIDLIVLNGRVYTADGGGRFEEAVAVRGNQIVRVGTNRDIKRLRRPQTQVIDAHGGTVLPGFNDARVDLLESVPRPGEVSLFLATTLERVQETIREFAAAEPNRAWIVGRGWNHAAFPGGMPTRQQLDAIVRDRPAYFLSRDGHTGWANSKTLELAGITRRTQAPPHGVIVTDQRTGEPTGILKEEARQPVEQLLAPASREDRLHALRAALLETKRAGITSIQSAGDDPADLDLYNELRRAGELTVRIYGVIAADTEVSDAELNALHRLREKYPDDPVLKAGAVALAVDGSIESQTAALLSSYSGRRDAGHSRYSIEELRRAISALDAQGWQIVMEAAGDGAVRMALDAYSQALPGSASSGPDRRHRLAGMETIDPDDISRFDASNLIAQQAPTNALLVSQSNVWISNLGIDRATRGWLWHSFAERSPRLVFSSDSPAAPLDPMMGLYAATMLIDPEPADPAQDVPDRRLSLQSAIDAYTRHAAYASFDEQRKGVLAPGMLADIVVLSTDIFSLPPDRLLDGRVDVTIFDGKVVYRRQPSPTTTN